MAKFRTSAGSFVLKQKKPRAVTTYIHSGGKAACGGGNALSAEKIGETATNVSEFAQSLGWGIKVSDAVETQLRKMPLSENPREHARQLHKYYGSLGIRHRAIVEDLEAGRRETIVQSGNWLDWILGENAACADARHAVQGKPRTQTEQTPENFYFGEKPVSKSSYNKVFTIAGISPQGTRKLLFKASRGETLTPWEAHNVAAVMLSTYYYCAHKWPRHEALRKIIQR